VTDRTDLADAYIEAALWADPETFSLSDTPESVFRVMRADASAFYRAYSEWIERVLAHERLAAPNPSWIEDSNVRNRFARAGHDLWLTRQGHGAGFDDGHWPRHAAKILGRAARALGEFYPGRRAVWCQRHAPCRKDALVGVACLAGRCCVHEDCVEYPSLGRVCSEARKRDPR